MTTAERPPSTTHTAPSWADTPGSPPRDPRIRRKPWLVVRLVIVTALLLVAVLREASAQEALRTRQAAAPYTFSLLSWELGALAPRVDDLLRALRGQSAEPDAADLATIRAYFETARVARPPQRPAVEQAIQRLVTDALAAEGLVVPSLLAGGQPTVFPPVSFTLTEPPRVLVVSPRDRIAVQQYVLLRPDLAPEDISLLEEGVARRGYSTLVTPIGGLATYPAMVLEGSPEATLAAVAHEWVHAFFMFFPLGWGYWGDYDLRTINETAAELAGDELAELLVHQAGLRPDPPRAAQGPRQAEFNRLMRQTRREVDLLLAQGQVEQAERLMEQRRQEINALGYAIRRLNQAYFAFHGSYAEGPAGSGPVPGLVRRLRTQSPSLGAFLNTIAQVDSLAELESLVR